MTDRRYTAHSFEEAARDKVADEVPDADLDVFAATFDLVRLATRVVHDLESRVHRPAGWSYAGFRVMFTVWVAGSLPPMDIAHLSGLSRAAVSSVVNTLERDGLVTRSRESDDRRVVTVRLTDEGERRLVEAYAEQNERSSQLWRDLSTPELATFTDLCRRALGTRRQTD
jgi:DNA-binding MarR family transcriptional regulator